MWDGDPEKKTNANVSWNTVCQPCGEGGLGIKDFYVWSHACLAMKLWDVARGKECLWVKWLHTYRLKGIAVWGYKEKQMDHWF